MGSSTILPQPRRVAEITPLWGVAHPRITAKRRDFPVLSDELAELLEDGGLGAGADDRLHDLALGEDRHGRDGHDLVVAGDARVLVDVHLRDGDLSGILAGDLFEHGSDQAARTAPLRPEVDEYWPCLLY